MRDDETVKGRLLVVVLGMHRSGTSVLTAALHALGVWAAEPSQLQEATPENARGYWELRDMVALNDDLLQALGSTWDAPHVPPVVHLGATRYAGFAERARRLLTDAFGKSPNLVIKDPRMCRLLDFWIVQFEALGLDVRYILSLRDPVECALSMNKRDRLPLAVGRWLWVDHMVSACNQTAGRNRLFVVYDRLLDSPIDQLARLALFLGIGVPLQETGAAAVIVPELRHQRREQVSETERAGDSVLGNFDGRVYSALLAFAEGDAPNDDALRGWHAVRREVMRLRAGRYPTLEGLPARSSSTPVKTAIVLHLYYPEQWPELLALLEHLAPDIDLFATITGPQASVSRSLIENFDPSAMVLETPNRGRDIAPFLSVLPTLIAQQYDCVCKLHTKRSDYSRIDGLGWRFDLWAGLIGRSDEVEHIRVRFGMDASLGMLGLHAYWVSVQDFRDSRHDRVLELANTLLTQRDLENWHFFAGTMFWFRPSALLQLLSLGFSHDDFEPEQGQREGTLAHAIERLLPLAGRARGHWIDTYHPAPMQRSDNCLPPVFAQTSTEQLLDELRGVREQLTATETALSEVQSLALDRMSQIEMLQTALTQAQRLALERLAYIEKLHQSPFGRIALALKLMKP